MPTTKNQLEIKIQSLSKQLNKKLKLGSVSNFTNESVKAEIITEKIPLSVKATIESSLHEFYKTISTSSLIIFFKSDSATIPVENNSGTKSSFNLNIQKRPLIGVDKVVVVSSGKGGVGKSTVTASLAISLRDQGYKVAILDADIHGPSIPKMFGVKGPLNISDSGKLIPKKSKKIDIMSFGFFSSSEDTPFVAKGPIVSKTLLQLAFETSWENIDYLLIDLPPGTGDIPMTLIENLPIFGAAIVTTPQDIALIDAKKGISMFQKLDIPIIGLIENMAYYTCKKCGHKENLLGNSGVDSVSDDFKIPVIGKIPLIPEIAINLDNGTPEASLNNEDINALYRNISTMIVDW